MHSRVEIIVSKLKRGGLHCTADPRPSFSNFSQVKFFTEAETLDGARRFYGPSLHYGCEPFDHTAGRTVPLGHKKTACGETPAAKGKKLLRAARIQEEELTNMLQKRKAEMCLFFWQRAAWIISKPLFHQ